MLRDSEKARKKGVVFAWRADQFVVARGELVSFEIETSADPSRIDHFWITIRAGDFGRLRISISTFSLKHATDGFDPRMRLGIVVSHWSELPASGIFPAAGLNYAEFERAHAIGYREMERPALEELLAAKAQRAIFVEAWGAIYSRDRLGLHQVHSRRASCSVRSDYIGRDGALRLYYRDEAAADMLLFKYCGQV